MDKFSLEGKVALVTGPSSGIGRETARLFAEYGAKVFLAARRESRLQELKAEIEAAGGIAGYTVCDVSIEEDCKNAIAACVEEFGKLDILVNSAGIGDIWQGLEGEFNTEKYEKVMRTDFGGVFFMIKYAYPEMEKGGGGSIISISSISAFKCYGVIPYSAAKGAIRSMDRALARELGARKIRVNSIYPGTVLSEMSEKNLEDKDILQAQIDLTALGRIGLPEDIAYCALYLASDVSSFVTGQAFIVDGGQTC